MTTGFGELLAVDPASGGVIWRQRLRAPVTGAPTVADGVVYVVARDDSAWAVDAVGRPREVGNRTARPRPQASSAVPARLSRIALVILPFPSGELVGALREGGAQIWNASAVGRRLGRAYGIASEITADPVVAGAVTYVGNASGRTVAHQHPDGRDWSGRRRGRLGPVAVAGGSIFLVNDQARTGAARRRDRRGDLAVALPYFTETKPRKIRRSMPITARCLPAGGWSSPRPTGAAVLQPDRWLACRAKWPCRTARRRARSWWAATLYVVSTKGQLHAFR